MNQEKIGKFISLLRKEKKLTQEELGDKLGCSSKSISRWETGKCMPDLSLLIPLSKELNVSLNELLTGEKNSTKNIQENLEETTIEIIKTLKNNFIKKFIKVVFLTILTIIIIIILGFLSFTLITAYNEWPVYLEQDKVNIEVCSHNDKTYISMKVKDGYGAEFDINYDNDKANIRIYRGKKSCKYPEKEETHLPIIIKEEKVKNIYYDFKLIWDEKMEINECNN